MKKTKKNSIAKIKKTLFIYRIAFYSLWIVFMFSMIFFVIDTRKTTKVLQNIVALETILPKNFTINYSDLNKQDKEIAMLLVNELNPLYLAKQKSLTFTTNLTEFYTGKKDPEKLLGFNRGGNNFVKFRADISGVRRTISHEFLHTFCKPSTNETHKIIYDLAKSCPASRNGCK